MSIWVKTETAEVLNKLRQNTLNGLMGIRLTEIGEDFLKAIMPVDDRTRQPMGILHGGASAVLAESIGSLGSYLSIGPDKRCVGLEINAAEPGYIMLRKTAYPDWQLYVDGLHQEMLVAEPSFISFQVNAGIHDVVLIYSYLNWRHLLGFVLSVIGLIALALFSY